MSIDGAHDGVGPKRALDTILGGKPAPTKDEAERREVMREKVMASPEKYEDVLKLSGDAGYEAGCYWLAKQFIFLRESGKTGTAFEMFEHMKDAQGRKEFDFTGFMVGYANNLARWILDMPPVENPAIITIP